MRPPALERALRGLGLNLAEVRVMKTSDAGKEALA